METIKITIHNETPAQAVQRHFNAEWVKINRLESDWTNSPNPVYINVMDGDGKLSQYKPNFSDHYTFLKERIIEDETVVLIKKW